MSLFELAIPTILRHEGGFVNDSADPGGATNFGVSLRWLKSQGMLGDLDHDGDVDQADIKALTKDAAAEFYHKFWWDAYQYGMISAQAVATKVFDMAVNMGASRAHKIFQGALGVPQDGVLGRVTFTAANASLSLDLLTRMQNRQVAFYHGLVASNPSMEKFLNGWLNRAYDRN